MRTILARAIALAAVAATTIGGFTGTAAAAGGVGVTSTTIVDGAGVLTDDFGDHADEMGEICRGCSNSGNTDLVILWQSILAAEGLLSAGSVDGEFGDRTHTATVQWQRDFGLAGDGRVGDNTWGAADDRLYGADGALVYYRPKSGGDGKVWLDRDSSSTLYAFASVRDKSGGCLQANPTTEIHLFKRTISLRSC
ncbi:peptidoglycan-binding domain-containing protein [Phytomonospora sp. NPDC050363]|uniref:peptidoglycan-binding domain-containing protein n=1 Tax=Phytomonospora sp. NPDC050363 TaxID=3155642 RepID=UPI00340460E8